LISLALSQTLGVMNSTNRHLAFAILWLVALPAVVVPVVIASEPGALSTVSSRIASVVWVLGFAGIFYSWARIDAPLHGKSSKAAIGFAVAWPFLLVFSHVAYLLYTRGVSMGLISILKFSCFLLAVGILWLAVGRILGGVI